MQTTNYHIQKIREVLSRKQKMNPAYSVRALARDLEMHPSTMNKIINGERNIPTKDSERIMAKLDLSPKEKVLFMNGLIKSKVRLDKLAVDADQERFLLDESHYKIIAEWEHFAVLELFHTEGFKCSAQAVTHRLDLTPNRAQVVLDNLLTAKLIQINDDGEVIKTHEALRTTEDISSSALRIHHKECLRMGIEKIDLTPLELRDFSTMTIPMDTSKMDEVKSIIREFRLKMKALLKDGTKQDVYKLAIQFYPLTKKDA